MGDPTRGLYDKFSVKRNDGSSEPGRKHHGCKYFVLDMTHDPFAATAIESYALVCAPKYPALARDLTEWVRKAHLSSHERLLADTTQRVPDPTHFGPATHVWNVSIMLSKDGTSNAESLTMHVISDRDEAAVRAAVERFAETRRGWRKAIVTHCSRTVTATFTLGLGHEHCSSQHAPPACPDGTSPNATNGWTPRRIQAAFDTLTRLGYTYEGGVAWKPPLGKAAVPTPMPEEQRAACVKPDAAGTAWINGLAVPTPRKVYSTAGAAAAAGNIIGRQITFQRARAWARAHRVGRDHMGCYEWDYHDIEQLAASEKIERRLPIKTDADQKRPYSSTDAALYASAPLHAATRWAHENKFPKVLPRPDAKQANYAWSQADVIQFAAHWKDRVNAKRAVQRSGGRRP